MALHRMRTINEVLRIIRETDPESAITANCIRSLCKNGTVRSVQTGNKTLVNLDDFLRVISISDKLAAVLTEYKEWYDQYKYDVGDRWHETNRLFISEDGKVMYPVTISYWVHKICDQAGLPHRTVHSLRHTNITMQIAAGVPLVTVAGHARTSTTTDIYSHFLKSSDRTAAEKIEELFD